MNKRTFLKKFTALSVGSPALFTKLDELVDGIAHLSPDAAAQDETFWAQIRSGYRLKPDYINLENGYYCFVPQETLENFIHHVREINYQGSYYMRTVQWDNKKAMSAKLAELAGCDPEEVVITRNTTESLDLIIGGQHWQAGDEAVMALQDYGAMLDMFELQAQRHGVVNKKVSVPNHPRSDGEIVELYANAITDKTRLLMVCHLVNITGQVLPIRKICDMAHSKGVDVMVDGAHAFGHINFNMRDLDCDYYGTSLHKWLSVPLGAGMLYVKKGKVPGIWPLFAEMGRKDDDILRLNHLGTHPVHTDLAIGNAVEYHQRLGPDRKEARLRYLQQYWTKQVRDLPHIEVNTPVEPHRSCGIANVGVKGMEPAELADTLMKKHRIWTVAINRPGVRGCRITPNIYTTPKELDVFVNALKSMGA
ncbi:aminotransferase class V-fold PLP-dependent enzyme [Flavilitoribacter nigricans]|uniref:Aminotransferase n=1 Tax=Flavilitoribacter nigricans (strain ATCC 23147 / DSM 23189 / NBRC 102662 / NCIMB 1420 / SS-2) TaxID=1122177 RepID=A0A2D0N5H8_FLAN2|nr:aminotransferase class V-fold PLP-dependent enzyme [Flavilitoribacter nigricans]PHN03648.1 aminotransferase [Flavilitoribacter nigricans DSM 23189 = NBRC 102662]